MDRTYDIFEILTDGFPVWRATANGREGGIRLMEQLAAASENEFQLMDVMTKSLIASTRTPGT